MNATQGNVLSETERLKLRLDRLIWDTADDIGSGWTSRMQNFTPSEAAAYAYGIKNAVHWLAEQAELAITTHQIDAALGERARRGAPDGKSITNLTLRQLANEIRDKRIAILDKYDGWSWRDPQTRKWEAKIRRLEREGFEEYRHREELDLVKQELRCLGDLFLHCLADHSWAEKYWAAKKALETPPLDPTQPAAPSAGETKEAA